MSLKVGEHSGRVSFLVGLKIWLRVSPVPRENFSKFFCSQAPQLPSAWPAGPGVSYFAKIKYKCYPTEIKCKPHFNKK